MQKEKSVWVEFRRRKKLVSEPKTCWQFAILDSTDLPSRYDRLNKIVLSQNDLTTDILMAMLRQLSEPHWGYYKKLKNDKNHDVSIQVRLTQEQTINLINRAEGEVDGVTAQNNN